MLLQILAAFSATVCFSIMFNTSKNQLIYSGIIGAMGWFVYLLIIRHLHMSVASATFFAALIVNILSQLLAKYRKAPVTVFLVAGIIPLVPGITFYQAIYYLITDQYELSLTYGLLTFQVAGVIALAVVLGSTLFNVKHLASNNKSPH